MYELALIVVAGVQLLSRVWLCRPRDCSLPGSSVLHFLPELAQTHVHKSVKLSSHFILIFIFPKIRVFSKVIN